jgi:ABC-2 type transport system permease protein
MSTMLRDDGLGPPAQAPLLAQIWDLFVIELTNWRWSWRSLLLTGTITPLFSIVGLSVFARDAGPQALAYVLTGNMVVSLMFGNMGNVESHFSFMRVRGVLEYFAALPVRKGVLVLAVALAFLLLSLPPLLVTLLVGSLLLNIEITLHPVLALVVPACALPLSGIGAYIACRVADPSQGGALTLLATIAMAALGPVVVPPDRLPGVMIGLGYLSPATYAASAFRQALLGPVTWRMALDLAVLGGLTAGLYLLVGRTMDWRQR